ncbi:uncharacterized protein BO72DRAFT_17212 [Aspergillus fijiensis CBS 313.89]|uniref:Uncharacterized protein n=1 Tax=Aspergillus fijiensis CBS 313.89 TaxID=1448319 RepID=A0A8G1REN2_9EURO|nr:uncharacterized protein BO72DRAFT_17212 [Aspergillus fijiensis CBS 313.89]RAK71368.1 hypothetical protein BO72DRAFT_17212 [Aspergillus fijiensis CBS 313.89]
MPFFSTQKRRQRRPFITPSLPDHQDSKPSRTGSHSIRALFTGKKTRPAAHSSPTTPPLPNGSETGIGPNTTAPQNTQGTFSISFHPKTQTTLCWQNIDPPHDLLVSLDEKALEQQFLLNRPRATEMIDTSRTTSPKYTSPKGVAASLLPGYNDVSGSVIVDWDGYPHFLSPQEEVDRKLQLEAAVQERMLGLPGAHQQEGHYAPPRYTPASSKSGSRSSHSSTSSGGSSGRR